MTIPAWSSLINYQQQQLNSLLFIPSYDNKMSLGWCLCQVRHGVSVMVVFVWCLTIVSFYLYLLKIVGRMSRLCRITIAASCPGLDMNAVVNGLGLLWMTRTTELIASNPAGCGRRISRETGLGDNFVAARNWNDRETARMTKKTMTPSGKTISSLSFQSIFSCLLRNNSQQQTIALFCQLLMCS